MSLALLPASQSDIPQIVSIYFAAFQNRLSLNRFPRTPAVRTWWEKNLHDGLTSDAHFRLLKIVKEDKIIAFAGWSMPIGEAESNNTDDEIPEWPKDGNIELCGETFRAMVAAKKELMGSRPHFCMHQWILPNAT